MIPETTHENSTAVPTIQKMPPAYSPVVDWEKPIGMKAATVTSAPVSRGIAVAAYEKAAAFRRSQPSSIFTTIISTAMMPSSTSRPSAMISDPSETRSRFQPIASITSATTPSTIGTESPTTMPVRQPRLIRQTASTIVERFQQRAFEFPDGFADDGGLIGHALELDAVRKLRLDLGDRLLDRLAEVDDVAVVGHRDAEHQHLLPVVAHGVRRRIFVSARDRREVAELDQPSAGGDRHVADIVQAGELAAHAHQHAVAARVDRAARQQAVLVSQAFGNLSAA